MLAELIKNFNETLKLQTLPVGINLLKAPRDGLKVKVKNKKITICQQIAYSRYYGWSTLCDKHTSFCVLGASCTGLIKTPARVFKGEVNCGVYQKDSEAAQKMQNLMPRISDEIKGVLTYPINRPIEEIRPDVIVFYCNTAQAMRMVQAFLYHEGGDFNFKSSGDAGVCSRGVAEVYKAQKPVIEIPCLGDRRFAIAQDFEMIVAFPYSYTEKILEGLICTHKAGIRYPIPFQIPENCELPTFFTTSNSDL